MVREARSDGEATRRRLIAAAAELFCRRGYDGASVAEITEAAGANIAAVSHHFGGKARLYMAVWKTLFERQVAEHPTEAYEVDGPAAKLLVHVRGLIRRTAGRGSAGMMHRLIRHEQNRPTGLIGEMFSELQAEARQSLLSTLAELSCRDRSSDEWCLIELSLLAETRAILPETVVTYEPLKDQRLDDDFLERYAAFVTEKTIALLRSPAAA